MTLTNKDYTNILDFYKIKHNKMKPKEIKEQATTLLSSKLCECIKKVKKTRKYRSEKEIIPICKHSVVKKKGFIARKFTCKKKKSILLGKLKNIKTVKTKTLKLKNKRK